MTDLPPIKHLDAAAKAHHFPNWKYLAEIECDYRGELLDGTIAHARTLEREEAREKETERLREALAKYEPVPVDPDRVALNRILNAYLATTWPYGRRDGAAFEEALAQYKLERPGLTEADALVMAREICERVRPSFAFNYRSGAYEDDPEVQFAKSLLLRDPAAMAEVGVGRG